MPIFTLSGSRKAHEATVFLLERAERIAKTWNATSPGEVTYEPVMRPDGHYVIVCIEETPNGARLRGYL